MPLSQREAIQLSLLLLCVPAQYLLSGNLGSGAGRSQAVLHLVNEVKILKDTWFKFESWKVRWMQLVSWILKVFIDSEETSNRYGNESPAVEVLQFRQKAGYFATSLEVRNERPPHLRYRIGQVVKHRVHEYKGVIIGWDFQAKAPESWLWHTYGNSRVLHNWPHYAVLVDEVNHSRFYITYVVQEQLELLKNTEVQNAEIQKYFEYFDGAQYIPREKLRNLYPRD